MTIHPFIFALMCALSIPGLIMGYFMLWVLWKWAVILKDSK